MDRLSWVSVLEGEPQPCSWISVLDLQLGLSPVRGGCGGVGHHPWTQPGLDPGPVGAAGSRFFLRRGTRTGRGDGEEEGKCRPTNYFMFGTTRNTRARAHTDARRIAAINYGTAARGAAGKHWWERRRAQPTSWTASARSANQSPRRHARCKKCPRLIFNVHERNNKIKTKNPG